MPEGFLREGVGRSRSEVPQIPPSYTVNRQHLGIAFQVHHRLAAAFRAKMIMAVAASLDVALNSKRLECWVRRAMVSANEELALGKDRKVGQARIQEVEACPPGSEADSMGEVPLVNWCQIP